MIVSDLYNRFAVCHMIASQQAPELHWCVHIRTISHIFWWINMLNMDIKLQNLTAKWPVIWPTIISQSLPQKTQQSVPWLLDIHQIFILIHRLEWQLYFLYNGPSHFNSRQYLTRIKRANTIIILGINLWFKIALLYNIDAKINLTKVRTLSICTISSSPVKRRDFIEIWKTGLLFMLTAASSSLKTNWSKWNSNTMVHLFL